MKRWQIAVSKVLLMIAVGMVIAALAFKFVLPGVLQSRVLKLVKESCATCTLEIGSTDLFLMNPSLVVFHDVKFSAGQRGRSVGDATVKALSIDLSLANSNLHRITADSVEIESVKVTYTEGDAPKKERPQEQDSGGGTDFTFVIETVRLSAAQFTYARTRGNVTSRLNVHNINGQFKNLGNTPESFKKMAEGHLSARLEKTGEVELDLAALLVPGPHYVDVSLRIRDQKLEDLNSYFTSDDGITLAGFLKQGKASVEVRDQKSKVKVHAVFKDVDFKQKATQETGVIEAALTNLAAGLFANKSNEDFAPAKQTNEMTCEREKHESIVHFILRSMKLSFIEVATAKK